MTYRCENSFEGILTAVFEAFRLHEDPEIRVSGVMRQLSMDGAERIIQTDPVKAGRVYRGIERKISPDALQQMYAAWLGEAPDVPGLILHAVRAGLRDGARVMEQLQDPELFRLHDRYRHVMKEVHFFLGALRFVCTKSGLYHAGYEPDGNITGLVAPHFAERLSDQPFLIHDIKRNLCAVYDGNEIILAETPPGLEKGAIDAEDDYERLWQRYFSAIAIESRFNPKLQRGFLPKRYWKHLPEMQGRP